MAEALGAFTALFRAFSMPGRKPRGEWITDSIEVGTRSTCALNLNDPVVAEHHCRFRATQQGFVVEDQGSATGTWHNGLAVRAPVVLKHGDQVVIGVTRMSIELKQDQDRAALEISVEEASFHYKRTKAGEFHTDADEWVRSEVRFGRIPAVRSLTWLAGVIALVGLVFVFATDRGERLLQPGELDGTHGAFFAADPARRAGLEVAVTAFFKDSLAHASCNSCHASSQPGDLASCVACHDQMGMQHPFLSGANQHDSKLAAGVAVPANACTMCHEVGHSGLSSADSLLQAKAQVAAGTKDASYDWGVCRTCHTNGLGDKEQILARVGDLAQRLVDAQAKPPTDRHEFAFDQFSHETHSGKHKIACAACHVALNETPAAGADYSQVGFETCAACHVEGMPTESELPEIPTEELKRWRARLELANVTWHSDSDKCQQCHVQKGTPQLVTLERTVATKSYSIQRMGHVQHAQAAMDTKADCRTCHGDQLKSLAGKDQPSFEKFLHGSHVATLWPASAEQKKELSAESCTFCHAEQWKSASLKQSANIDLRTACRSCHADQARPESEKVIQARTDETKTQPATEFPHDRHQGIEGGCFACHSFEGADDSDPSAQPFVAENIRNCTKCHTNHESVGGSGCAYCHPAGPSSAELFRGIRPSRDDWPAGFEFGHFQGDDSHGHMAYTSKTGALADEGCGKCHDLKNLSSAKTVREVKIPGGQSRLCVDCHATERGWFHWMLPQPTLEAASGR